VIIIVGWVSRDGVRNEPEMTALNVRHEAERVALEKKIEEARKVMEGREGQPERVAQQRAEPGEKREQGSQFVVVAAHGGGGQPRIAALGRQYPYLYPAHGGDDDRGGQRFVRNEIGRGQRDASLRTGLPSTCRCVSRHASGLLWTPLWSSLTLTPPYHQDFRSGRQVSGNTRVS